MPSDIEIAREAILKPIGDIADRLGIAVSTVEKQHARALRLLRADMEGNLDS